jgi:TRAP-type uncharacterized transport system substrate-binding protein
MPQDLLQWTNQDFSDTISTAPDIPLDPGAARYYQEVGYMCKSNYQDRKKPIP